MNENREQGEEEAEKQPDLSETIRTGRHLVLKEEQGQEPARQ